MQTLGDLLKIKKKNNRKEKWAKTLIAAHWRETDFIGLT